MTKLTKFASVAAALLTLVANPPSAALAQAEHEQHHPDAAPPAGAQPEQVPADKGTNSSEMPKGGMMGDMMRGGTMGNMLQGGGMMEMMQGCPMMGGGDTATHVHGRVAFLKAELAVTDVQQGVWDAYAAVLAKNLEGMQSAHKAMMKMMQTKSSVERLDTHIAVMESRIGSLKEMKPALADLYAALSDEQKKTADQLLTGMGCMM